MAGTHVAAASRCRLHDADESAWRAGDLHFSHARHSPGGRHGYGGQRLRCTAAIDSRIRGDDMNLVSNAAALLGKELRTEFRSRELLTTTVVFVLMVIVLFSFTFN